MENKEKQILNLQKKSHEALIKLLNNIGVVGSILAAIADIIFVIIFVLGVQVDTDMTATIIFSVINALIGLLINILLRYQGQRYAELENEDLCNKFHRKKAEKKKKHLSMGAWQVIKGIQDFIIKGCTTVFSIFGIIYISIQGSKNPIQILITFVTLVLFACFGLIGMNSSYCRFYDVQIPYMEIKVKEKIYLLNGGKNNGTVQGRDGISDIRGTSRPLDESTQRAADDKSECKSRYS